MTGFAVREREIASGTLLLELRAVNHRYLELHMRLDDALRTSEPMLRETIASCLVRGKVECRASLVAPASGSIVAEIDAAALAQLAQLELLVHQQFPHSQMLSVADILRWPGILSGKAQDNSGLGDELQVLLAETLQELIEARGREGQKLKEHMLVRVAAMEEQVAKVRPLLPELLRAYQDKLQARLQEALQTTDDDRIRQELALFAQKIDVDEELDRLTTHLQEVKRVLAKGGAVGKRLDFLMQELNREANTLGSKSVSSVTSQVSMELKVLIEQIREQVQNIE
jgi:uncharacterized protein (TIGR00255 family)